MSDSDPESDQPGEMAYELPADRNRIERLHGIRGTRKGFKNKVSAEAREFCLRIVRSRLYRIRLLKAALERTLHPRIEEMLWRAAGYDSKTPVAPEGEGEGSARNLLDLLGPELVAEAYRRSLGPKAQR
jgi:hypothetical protein